MGSAPHTGSTPADRATADGATDGATDGAADGAHALTTELAAGAPAPPGERGDRRRRSRLLSAGALVVVLAAIAVVVALASSSPSHRSSAGAVPAGETTTTVSRRTLSESATVDGTLAYGSSLELYDRLSGTYTWLPSVGAVVGRGGALWRIDDEPVVLMYGTVPAYRTLKEGVSSGPDVVELNRNLIGLGFDPHGAITDAEDFGEATADAVKRFEHADGLPETGEVELGRVVFAPSARRVTAVHVQLGEDPSGSPSGESSPGSTSPGSTSPGSTSPGKSPSGRSPSSKRSPSHRSPSHRSPSARSPSSKSPSAGGPSDDKGAEDESSDDSPKGSGESEPGAGSPAEAVLGTTPTQQLVQLKLKPSQQQLARTGQTAPVTLPSGSVVQGRVVEVGSVASESAKGDEPGGGGESESATIPVTLALERTVPHLDEAPVSVEFVKSVRREVLAVPATALTATGGGGYAIEALENGRRVQLPVTTGMFADGYVQVEGAGVQEGLTVLESE